MMKRLTNTTAMSVSKISMCLASLAILLATHIAVQAQPERLFYYVDDQRSFTILEAHIGDIDVLAPGAFSVDADGIVWGQMDQRVLRLAAEHDVPVMPLIVNPGFDQEMLSTFLSNDTARRRAIKTMVDKCEQFGLLGLQFDFENLSINDKDAFSRFFKEAADALHANGRKISIAVVHRPDESPGSTKYLKWLFKNWRAGYDLDVLGEYADFISLMTYSQHTRRTTPGPNASIPWMIKNIQYFLKHVPPEKLSLGIAVTSQHWSTQQDDRYFADARSWSESLSYSEAASLAERYDAKWNWLEDQGVAYTFFDNGGVFEWMFLEDARSFRRKLDLVGSYDLRGFSIWVMGYEDPEIWGAIAR
ncbi:MAG: glycosyl hydrolase family 18 protein [Rhodothermales bacterium]